MKLQERLQDKRENFRVSIRRTHNNAMLKRRRVEIVQESDYGNWVSIRIMKLERGKQLLYQLTCLLNTSCLEPADVLLVLSSLQKLLERVPSERQQSFVTSDNYLLVTRQILTLLNRFLKNPQLYYDGFSILANLSGIPSLANIETSTEQLMHNPVVYLQSDMLGKSLGDYLQFVGNVLAMDRSAKSVRQLLERGIVVALLKLFRSEYLKQCFRQTLMWFIRILLEAILNYHLQHFDSNLSKLLQVYRDETMNICSEENTDAENCEFLTQSLRIYIRTAVELNEDIPIEILNYIELVPLSSAIVKLLVTLTFQTSYCLSDVRIRQLVNTLFDCSVPDPVVFMLLKNNICNQPSSRCLILQQLLRRRQNVPPMKLYMSTGPVVYLYEVTQSAELSAAPLLELLLEIIQQQGGLGTLEECVGYFCEKEDEFQSRLEQQQYIIEEIRQ